jgi:hypothetical protein
MGKRASESKRGWLAPLAVALVTASCIGPLELEEVLLWEGVLKPAAGASTTVSGTMAMVANERFTQVGLGIDAGEPGITVGWVVRHGSCDSPGNRVAPPQAFLPLVIGESGEGEREAIVNYRLARGGYAGQVSAASDGSGEILGCADLMERD